MTMIDTPDGIAFFRLAAFKGAIAFRAELGQDMPDVPYPGSVGIGKRDYGLTGTAKTMAPIVAQQVEDVTLLRRYSRAYIQWAVETLGILRNDTLDEGFVFDEAMVRDSVSMARLPHEQEVLLLAVYRVQQFESRSKPAVRVVFRASSVKEARA